MRVLQMGIRGTSLKIGRVCLLILMQLLHGQSQEQLTFSKVNIWDQNLDISFKRFDSFEYYKQCKIRTLDRQTSDNQLYKY